MKKNLNILFVAAEVAPFSKAGGLADVAGALPGALKHLDCNTTIMTPLYGFMDKKSLNLSRPEYSTEITFADEPNRADYYFVMHNGIDILFLENESFYQRDGIYTDSNGQGYEDNFGRFLFLQKAALAVLEKRLIVPDVVHVNDHHTALLPWMMKNRRLGIPSLLTIHNSMYQGEFSTDDVLLLDEREQIKLSETKQTLNSLDIGLHHADAVNTVSKTYREELLEKPELSYGLYKTYIHISERFHGILNGADYAIWNPETDPKIKKNYSIISIKDKQQNKLDLFKQVGLPAAPSAPLIGSVSRQVASKGFFLILDCINELINLDCRFVFLGTGDNDIMSELQQAKGKYPNHIAVVSDYNEPLSHQIEAGADIFIMPSEVEPCGLNQIYSLKYGTIPVVHRTGGLADTVIPWEGKKGNGFVFSDYSKKALLSAMKEAINAYKSDSWDTIITNAMNADFSWNRSAKQYKSLYNTIINVVDA